MYCLVLKELIFVCAKVYKLFHAHIYTNSQLTTGDAKQILMGADGSEASRSAVSVCKYQNNDVKSYRTQYLCYLMYS